MPKLFITFLLTSYFLLIGCGSQLDNDKIPSGLSVEFIREPPNTLIQDNQPEYGWIVPANAIEQSAYQIIVSSSDKNCRNGEGDIWDSGNVKSDQTINIEHAGQQLSPQTTYFWKVKIWDSENLVSDYSEIQKFTTGDFKSTISTPNSFISKRITPDKFAKTSGTSYFIDFGKSAFGTLELTYHAETEETLTIGLGEKISDGKIDRNPGGTIRFQEVKLTVSPDQQKHTLELDPDKRNTNERAVALPDSFGIVMPFRYAEIENASSEIQKHNIMQKAYFYYFEDDESSFSSSDSILNQVWDICKYSMKATSFAGLYVDGDRERIPYEADAYINQLSHYAVDREYAIAKQTIEYFMDNPTWPTEWLLHTAMMFYQDYYYTGDTELLQEFYDKLKHKTLLDLAREDGLITTVNPIITDEYMAKLGFRDPTRRLKDIVDWPPAQKDTGWKLATKEGERDGYDLVPINTVVNCFFYQNMLIMKEFASIMNNKEDEKYFHEMSEKVKTAINEKLLDAEKGFYVDGEGSSHSSLHANMLPLAFDIVPKEYVKSVVDFVKSRGMACSVYGAQYLLEGLYKYGEDHYALDLMTAQHDRSWYNMIKVGSTITLEAWDQKYKPNLDWNHAWGAAPGNIIARYLWGIQPTEPGFESATIKPQMGDLTYCQIETPTILGNIKGTFEKIENRIKYVIEVPANLTMHFLFDDKKNKTVLFDGEAVDVSSGSVLLNPGRNVIEFL